MTFSNFRLIGYVCSDISSQSFVLSNTDVWEVENKKCCPSRNSFGRHFSGIIKVRLRANAPHLLLHNSESGTVQGFYMDYFDLWTICCVLPMRTQRQIMEK